MEDITNDGSVTVFEDNTNASDADQYSSESLNLSNTSNSENQGLLLLRRLQQLKVWQARQEALLLEEQQQQINFKLNGLTAGSVEKQEEEDIEDDTTISSLSSDLEESHADRQIPVRAEDVQLQLHSLGPSPSPDRVEDQPLGGGGKTFAQLLAEQLAAKENEEFATPDKNKKVVTPKPFLKRGAGLTRFNLQPDLAKQRARSRSESRQEQTVTNVNEISLKTIKPPGKRIIAPRYLSTPQITNSKPNPVKNDKQMLPNQSPPSMLKLKPSISTSELSKPRSQPPPKPAKFNLCDSVENSFCDKLSVQAQRQEKDLKELEVFQMLEDAANDSSFCSNSSKIKSLVSNAMLATPNRMKNPNMSTAKTSFASSTPASHLAQLSLSTQVVRQAGKSANGSSILSQKDEDTSDPSLGESLMDDIRKFLQAKVAKNEVVPPAIQTTASEDDSEWTDESDDDTLDGEEDLSCQTIGRNWQDLPTPTDSENKENAGYVKVLDFSPPEKLPADPPSHLIWEIFGREREMRKKQQEHIVINKSPEPLAVRRSAPPKPAPLNVRFENSSKPDTRPSVGASVASSGGGNHDLSYQSTLLHMRVVELEQEISNFKKENNKINTLKKKMQADKDKLSKELSEFESLKVIEKKKIEEDKRRIKRDKMLLEKGKKDQQKVCNECDEKIKQVDLLNKEMKLKEQKWKDEVSKLKEQLRKSSKDRQELENENQKLRLRKVNSKVSFGVEREAGPEVVVDSHKDDDFSLSSSEEERLDVETRRTISNTIYNTLCQGDSQGNTPRGVSSAEPEEMTGQEKGAREKRFSDGRLEVWYSNGNRKEVSGDGSCVKIFYYNGDVKETHNSGLVRYLYSHTQTWHTQQADGTEVLQFSNGQEETRLPDGSSSISFPDGSTKTISQGGEEKISFPDGTEVVVQPSGDRVLHLPSGQVEEHTSQYKRRTYPDGTVKILHMDGRQETRYAGGRVRVKDSKGVLVQDTGTT